MTISPMMIYFINMSDSICTFLGFLALVFLIIFGVVFYFLTEETKEKEFIEERIEYLNSPEEIKRKNEQLSKAKENIKTFRFGSILFLCLFLIFSLSSLFIPSTQTLWQMLIIPKATEIATSPETLKQVKEILNKFSPDNGSNSNDK